MEGKKRYVAIILFLLICLMLFTFATTGEEELETGKGNDTNIQEVTNKGDSEKDKETEKENSNESNAGSTGSSNNGNSNAGDDEDLEGTGNTDNSAWDNALKAVEELEKLLTDDQLNIARELVEEITNSNQYKELIERVEDAEDAIDATALVEALEKMVEEAAKKEDINDASDFRDEEVLDSINDIDGEYLNEVKEELLKRVEELNKILDDETAPTVEGIKDGDKTKEDVELTITDDNEVTTTVTKDGKTYDNVEKFTEEGTYEVTVVDSAFNETKLTFTIDKTAAKVKSSDFYVHGLTAVEKVFYTQKGNKITVNVKVNEQLANVPTFTLHSNGKDYVLTDVLDRGENAPGVWLYQASYVIEDEMADGEVTFTISNIVDLAGNVTDNVTAPTNGRRVIVDNTAPVYDNLALVGGKGYWFDKEYKQFATNGTIVYVNVRFKEKLATTPVVTLNDTIKLTKPGTVKEDKGLWIYSYSYRLTEGDGLVDGTLNVKVTNIADLAGNTLELTNADCKMESQSEIIVDRQPITIEGIDATEYTYDGVGVKPSTSDEDVKSVELTKDGQKVNYELGNAIVNAGSYKLTVTDLAGNKTTKEFVINKKQLEFDLSVEEVYEYAGNEIQATINVTNAESTDVYEIDERYYIMNDKGQFMGPLTVDYAKDLGTYKVKVVIKSTSENYADSETKSLTFKVVDTTAPQISLNGESKITIEAGIENYEEKYATVTDNYDETITDLAVSYINYTDKDGNFIGKVTAVDNKKLGTYKVVYTHTDSNGNVGVDANRADHDYVIRLVTVVDTTAPQISLNGESKITLEAGKDNYKEKNATVTDNYDETITNLAPAYINYTDKDGKFVGKVTKVDNTKLGTYKVVYTHTDSNGNVGVDANRADHDYVIRLVTVQDTIKPTLTVKDESIGTDPIYSKISFKLSDSNQVDYLMVNGNKFDVTNAKWSDANYGNIKNYLVEGENTAVLYDTAGNSTSKTFTMDWTAPEVVEFNQKYEAKEDGRIKVTLTFNETIKNTLGQGWYKVEGKENTYAKVYYSTKEHTVSFEDLAGNKNTYTFAVDATPNRVTQTFYRGDKNIDKTYYVKNGDKIQFNIGFSEKLGEDAVITIGGKKVELTYEKYFEATKSHMYYGYLEVAEDETELVEGELEISISNITDEVGNPGFYYQTNGKKVMDSYKNVYTTNGKKVIYDNTPNRVTQTFFRGENEIDKVYYLTNGSKIQFNIGFRETLSEDAVVTIGGKKVELTYEKYVKDTNSHMYYGYLEIAAEDQLPEGILDIKISNITDFVGNKGFYYQTNGKTVYEEITRKDTTNGKQVFYDVTGPEVTPSYTETTTEQDEEFTNFPTFEVKDNSNQSVTEELISGSVDTTTIGSYKLTYRFTDVVGNYTDVTVTVKVVDTKAPTIEGLVDGAYYNTKDTHAIPSAYDKNGVTVFVKTTIKDAELISLWKNNKEIVQVGTYQVYAVDKFGNKSEEITVHIDPYAPKVLVLDRVENVSGAYLPIKPVILEHNLDTIEVTLDGKKIDFKEGDQLTKDGKYVMTVTDKAKNSTTVEFTMDSVAPTMMVSPTSLGVVDSLDLNDADNITGLLLSEDADFQLMKVEKNITVLGKEIPIYKYTKLPEDGIIDEEGQYIIIAYDKAYNVTAYKFIVDRSAPTVNVEEGKYYSSVTINVEDANMASGSLEELKDLIPGLGSIISSISKLDPSITIKEENDWLSTTIENGYVVDEDGTYTLTAKDVIGVNPLFSKEEKAAHTTTVTFHIDTKKPTANVVEGGVYKSVTVAVEDAHLDEESITINGKKYDGKEITEEGNYVLEAKDLAGNTLTVNFEVDKTPITISGAKEFNNSSVEIKVESKDENPTIELNGIEVEKEFTASKEGENEVVVVDKWGNKETVTFVIDTIKPVINNPTALPKQNTTVGAVKNTSINVVASVTDANATNVEILPTVSHDKHGDMGKLSTIATDKANVGTYKLTYDTVDKAGNAAEPLVLYVEVVVDDYVLSFNDIKTTYNYGETIPALTFADLTLVSDEENITLVDGDITFDVNTNTMKNAGKYTVKATLNKTIDSKKVVRTATITFEVKPIKATVSFIKNNGFGAVNAETGLFEYEFDGNSNPFSATVEGILDADKETVKVTVNYDKEVFGVKTYKAIATLNSDNYYLENNTYNFEVKKANATVKLPTTIDGKVEVTNSKGQDISEYATIIVSEELLAEGSQDFQRSKTNWDVCVEYGSIFGSKYCKEYEKTNYTETYNLDLKYKTLQVVSNEYMIVGDKNEGLTESQLFKAAEAGLNLIGINVITTLKDEVTENIPTTGIRKAYITDLDYTTEIK